mmetsp:Transcript_39556/g.62548  ORF Transcript_39556/g.62548 Transcript_39556/m.62548 type:complete len:184 (-) Transcript_39556:9-560(-)
MVKRKDSDSVKNKAKKELKPRPQKQQIQPSRVYASEVISVVNKYRNEKPLRVSVETTNGGIYTGDVVQSDPNGFYWSLSDVTVNDLMPDSTILHMDSITIPGTRVRYVMLGHDEESEEFFVHAYSKLCTTAKEGFEKRTSEHEMKKKFKTMTAHNQAQQRKKVVVQRHSERKKKANLFDVFGT